MISGLIGIAASLLSGWAVRLTPPAERDWARAMRAELRAIDAQSEQLAWAAGAVAAAFRMRLATGEGRFDLLCLTLLAGLTIFDWKNSDPRPTLLLLGALPALLAFARPERARGIGLLFGFWLLGAHWLADFSRALWPFYQWVPLSSRDLIEIAAVAGIAIPAAWLGARLRLAV